MGLDALLARMEARGAGTPVTPRYTDGVTAEVLSIKARTPVTPVTPKSDHASSDAEMSAVDAVTTVCRCWRVRFPGLDPMEVIFTPEASHGEVAALYDGAVIEALTEPTRRTATVDEAAELRALIEAVLTDAPDEWDEVHRLACADPESALICWRSLVVEVPPVVPPFPDPPTCRQCLNVWRCRKPPTIGHAASRGTLTSPPYDPAIDVGLRCESYRPNAADPDQRPAWERWPDLFVWRRD